ncbi:MAG: hypothetical protein MK105_02760 [Crocinitomicaceae bacterium]|nr:hypothetical protein [Crocinitomicaceae bacterium]
MRTSVVTSFFFFILTLNLSCYSQEINDPTTEIEVPHYSPTSKEDYWFNNSSKNHWRTIRENSTFIIERLNDTFDSQEIYTIDTPAGYYRKSYWFNQSTETFYACFTKGANYQFLRYNLTENNRTLIEGIVEEDLSIDKIHWGENTVYSKVRNKWGLKGFDLIFDFNTIKPHKVHLSETCSNYFEEGGMKWVLSYSSTNFSAFGSSLKYSYRLNQLNDQFQVIHSFPIETELARIENIKWNIEDGEISICGLTKYSKNSLNTRWGILAVTASQEQIAQNHLWVTDIDEVFDCLSVDERQKSNNLLRRDKLKDKGKHYNISPYVLSFSNTARTESGLHIALDFAEPHEEWEEPFGINDEGRWVIEEYRHQSAVILTFNDDLSLINASSINMEVGVLGSIFGWLAWDDQLSKKPITKKNKSALRLFTHNGELVSACRYENFISMQYFTSSQIITKYFKINDRFPERKDVKSVRWQGAHYLTEDTIILESLLKLKGKKNYSTNLRVIELTNERTPD